MFLMGTFVVYSQTCCWMLHVLRVLLSWK